MSIRVRDLIGTNDDPDVSVVLSTILPVTATAREAGRFMADSEDRLVRRVRALFPHMDDGAVYDMAGNIADSEGASLRSLDEWNAAEEAFAQAEGDEDVALDMLRDEGVLLPEGAYFPCNTFSTKHINAECNCRDD